MEEKRGVRTIVGGNFNARTERGDLKERNVRRKSKEGIQRIKK